MTEPTRADVFWRGSGRYWYRAGTHTHGFEVKACEGCGEIALIQHVYGNSTHGRFCSKSCATSSRTGAETSHWRGDDAKYWGQHQRVYRARGKATECVWGCDADSYEWANLTGNYLDVEDYAPMCKRCHKRYDGARAMMDRDEIRDRWGKPWQPGRYTTRHLGQHMPGGQTGDVPETLSQAHAGQGTRNGSTSRFTGVSSRGRKWAVICGPEYLGVFADEEDAARAYDAAALARWGRFARLNFPV